MLRWLLRPTPSPAPLPFAHSEGTIKGAEKYLDFVKNELDRLSAKSRLLEERSRTLATFALAGGTVATLIRPLKILPIHAVLLAVIGLLTLGVVAAAIMVNWGRSGSTVDDRWLERYRGELWREEHSQMAILNQLQGAYIDGIIVTHGINDSKSRFLQAQQVLVVIDLVAVIAFLAVVVRGSI